MGARVYDLDLSCTHKDLRFDLYSDSGSIFVVFTSWELFCHGKQWVPYYARPHLTYLDDGNTVVTDTPAVNSVVLAADKRRDLRLET